MSETRRDLFKTSVLSGLGLMSASALAACSGNWPTVGTPPQNCWTNGNADSPNWILASGTVGGTSNWYVFQYVPVGAGSYNAFVLTNAAYTPPNPSTTNTPFDVRTWYSAAPHNFGPASGDVTIRINSQPKMIKCASGVVTDPTSKQILHGQFSNYIVMSWNEIAP